MRGQFGGGRDLWRRHPALRKKLLYLKMLRSGAFRAVFAFFRSREVYTTHRRYPWCKNLSKCGLKCYYNFKSCSQTSITFGM